MICYRDKTFCTMWRECLDGEYCDRAYTEEVKEKATKCNLPVSIFIGEPDCYKKAIEKTD